MAYDRKTEHTYPKKFIKVKSKSGSEDVHYSVFSDDLPEEMKLAALRELNETEENKTRGIRTLRGFVKENDLKCTDDLLLTVLRHCKYDMKKSETKLESFLKVRQMVITKLGKMDLKTIESLMDEMPFGMLPYRDKHGRIIVYTRSFPRVDCYETDFIVVCAVAMLMFILSLPMTSAIGICYLDECKYSSVYEYYTTLKYFRRFLACVFDIPLRTRSVELVNEHFICRWFYNALRPVLPEKLTGRISFLGSGYKKLHKIYHPSLLPEEFGGSLGPMNDKIYRQKVLDFLEKLRAEHEYIDS